MQIQHHLNTTGQPVEKMHQVKDGEIYLARVKEQTSKDEAVLSIRGREFHVKFEGEVPKTDRVSVQVIDSKQEIMRVRMAEENRGLSAPSSRANGETVTQTLRQLGVQQSTPELRQAVSMILAKGQTLTKESVQDLQRFMSGEKIEGRLQTVQAIANKRLDVTQTHLRAVHEAMHGRPLNEVLNDLSKELDRDFKVEVPVRERLERSASQEQLMNRRESRNQTSVQLIREVRQDVQVSLTVNQAKERIETRLLNSNQLNSEQKIDISQVNKRAQVDAANGNERAGINRIVQSLSQLERVVQQVNHSPLTEISEKQVHTRVSQEGRFQEQIRQVSESLQKETSISRAVERVYSLVNHPQVNGEASRALERTITETRHLEQLARERVNQTLNQIERTSANQIEQSMVKEARTSIQQEGLTQGVRDQIASTIQQRVLVQTESVEHINKALKQAEQLQAVAKDRLVQSVQQLSVKAADIDTASSRDIPSLNEAIKESKMVLQREANLERAIQQIQTLLNGQAGIEESLKVELSQTARSANELQQQGRELKARQVMAGVLDKIEQTSKPVVSKQTTPEARAYIDNEQFQTSVEMASKTIAVTTVTEKLAQMTADFKHLQRDLSKTLDQVNRQVEQFRNMAQPIVKPLLETTIKKLDHAILKSEMMLLTDMKTERQLLQASSQLAEASKLLSRGKHREANQIVQEVKQLVDKMNFQPSETKVKHYTVANEKALREANLPAHSFSNQYSETVRGPLQEGSPRAMFETIRTLGLNRDSEVAQFLASGKEQQQEQAQRNLKTALMQLAQGEEETRVQQLASQALQNVTGQQLMSRSDQQGNLQNLFLQIPFLLQEKVENLQVFVNSRSEGEKVDWENCNLFFLMETPKMGEIGISVSASDRQLSVTIKNDNADFQLKMEPLVNVAVDKLSEIGYSINGIKYAKLKNDETITEEKEKGTSRQSPVMTEKGFDFKI